MLTKSRRLLIAAAVGALACGPANEIDSGLAAEDNSAEGADGSSAARLVADQFLASVHEGNYLGAAAMMHPEALGRFRDLFSAVLAMDPMGFVANQLFGRSDIGDLSDAELFASFLNRTLYADPDLQEALAAAEVQYLGEVEEGPDIVHVMYRQSIRLAPVAVRTLNIVSVQPYESKWRVLLPNEIEAMAVSLTVAA